MTFHEDCQLSTKDSSTTDAWPFPFFGKKKRRIQGIYNIYGYISGED